MDYKIGKYFDPVSLNNRVFGTYIKGKQKACLDVKNILSKLLYSKFQHAPVLKEDILNLIHIMDSKMNKCELESLNTVNGLTDVNIKGQNDLYSEVKEILEDFLCEYNEESTFQH
jgi:hypothetical protein